MDSIKTEGGFFMIAIGSDHAGFGLKQALMQHLTERGLEYKDFGTYTPDSCDYPVYARAVAEAVARGECERGIIVCGTGIGVSITANKVKGIRATVCHDVFSAKACRQHNDTNIITMGERVIGAGAAIEVLDAWLDTPFLGGRHARRVGLISQTENEYFK